MSSRRAWWPALAAAAVLALGACGDGGGAAADGVATLGDGGSGDGGSTTPTTHEVSDQEREDALLAFAACMREHGVDMDDPQVVDGAGGKGGVAIHVGGRATTGEGGDGGPQLSGPDEATMKAADEACGSIMEGVMGDAPQMDPEEEAEQRDRLLAFARCMREHGVDMADPTFDDGRVTMSMGDPSKGPVDEEVMEAAQEACKDLQGGPGMLSAARAEP